MTSKAGIEQVLKEASMRVTQPRVAVLAAVTANPHADTETIISAVHEEHPLRPASATTTTMWCAAAADIWRMSIVRSERLRACTPRTITASR